MGATANPEYHKIQALWRRENERPHKVCIAALSLQMGASMRHRLRCALATALGHILMPILDAVVESKQQRLARAQIITASDRRRGSQDAIGIKDRSDTKL